MAIFTVIGGFIASALLLPATILGMSTASLIGGALAIGASVALSGLTRTKLPVGKTPQAQATLNQAVGDRIRGYGRAKLAGTRAFWESRGMNLYQAVMFHSGEVDAIEQWWVGDRRVDVASTGFVTNKPFDGKYVRLFGHLGTSNQAADPVLMDGFPGIWTTAHRLRGIAYYVSNFRSPPAEEYQAVFPEGYNTPVRVVARLSKVYDPRTGVTAWSDNAALCILDYLTSPDGYKRSLSDIDLESFRAFANVCDEHIPLKGGGTEERYRIWGIYSLTEDPQDVLDRMRAACDAELYQTAEGKIAIRGGVWTPPTVTIEEKDILAHQLEQGNNRFAAFNELKVLYTSPQHDYQTTEAAAWVDLAAQAEQGPLTSDLALDLVPSASQARRLAKIHIAKSNPRWRGTITTNLAGLNALGERTIRVVLPELEIDDTFLVLGFSIRPDLTGCEISISALNSSAYAWNPATEELDAPPPAQDTRPDLTLETPVTPALRLVNRTITSTITGSAIRARVAAPSREDLQLDAEYRLAGDQWEKMDVASGSLEAFSGLVDDGKTYQVRARWRTSQGTAGPWSPTREIKVTINPPTPAAPTDLSAVVAGGAVNLSWDNPDTTGFYYTEVYRGTTTTFSAATKIAEVYGAAGAEAFFTDSAPGTGTRRYWVRAVNVAATPSAPTGPVTVTL